MTTGSHPPPFCIPQSDDLFGRAGGADGSPLLTGVLQCIAVYCGVLQCIAVYCSVLQCIAVYRSVSQCIAVHCSVYYRVIISFD